jgi:hypothetical protein
VDGINSPELPAYRQAITGLLDDPFPPRGTRSYEGMKRPISKAYPFGQPDNIRPPSKVTRTRDSYQAHMLDSGGLLSVEQSLVHKRPRLRAFCTASSRS